MMPGMNTSVNPELGAEGMAMLNEIWSTLDQPVALSKSLRMVGEGDLPSVYPVTDFAVAAIGSAALSLASLLMRRSAGASAVLVDRTLASRWFSQSIQPLGWSLPPTWDSVAGDYPTRDGWIKLHTNAPHHRAAALLALGLDPQDKHVTREAVAAVARTMSALELETEVVRRGGCAAEMRSAQAWAGHPQGRAVRAEPLMAIRSFKSGSLPADWPLDPQCPLRGIRVLDLTRILAGPVATRFLAGYGAAVLRIDPIGWDEPAVEPEITLGKKRARLDLRSANGRATFERLLSQAHVLVHGYRSDALENLGLGEARRRELNPGLVDVSLNAYGWTGDWRRRRGFDSLVQMSCGIAEAGMRVEGSPGPYPLPVQALDHATGYLMAASVLRGLARRMDDGAGTSYRASLARTAAFLMQHSAPRRRDALALRTLEDGDYSGAREQTPWGPAKRLLPPYTVKGAPVHWERAAGHLGDSEPGW